METNRSCPGCGTKMNEAFNGSIAIEACPQCWGAFFDFGEMYGSIETISPTADVTSNILTWDDKLDHEGKDLVCANCAGLMVEKEYLYDSWVYINFCNGCHSIFLDKHELGEIKNYYASLDESSEWKAMEAIWLKFVSEVNSQTEERYLKVRQELDGMYWIDDYLWIDKVADFLLRKFL
ncbi:MAG: hypothetical protein ACD_3C00131G0001 [uncultured bacterium (gcode 4)]|uniref:Transcription factor zinc-finger domain-containing protein n=1 Tax=uncultured bacterium (gcode 4) TaxID=1234023 RepID=K2GWZ9_9BACT|nr:MAG: hypothetical protein ACD_3C00131G0001 [uncultured bacterium (gcode 4)]